MSHYVVMVVGEDIEDILEPYNENIEVEPRHQTKEELHKEFMSYWGKLYVENKPASLLNSFEDLTLSLDGCDCQNGLLAGMVKNLINMVILLLRITLAIQNGTGMRLGGRWSGTLILKPGCEGSYGTKSWMNKDEIIPCNRCDGAYNKDIDWTAMNELRKAACL